MPAPPFIVCMFLKNENKSEISSEDESKISELIKNIENIIEN